MKLTKSIIREIIKEVISEAEQKFYARDPKGKKISVFTDKDNWKQAVKGGYEKVDREEAERELAGKGKAPASGQAPDEPKAEPKATKIAADPFDDKDDDGGFDVGGPAYPNVPKGAKTSKQAKAAQTKAKSMKGITNAWFTGENFEGFQNEFNSLYNKLRDKYGYKGPTNLADEISSLQSYVHHGGEDMFRQAYEEDEWATDKPVSPEAKKLVDKLLARYADHFIGPDDPSMEDELGYKEESITSKLKREFKQYDIINKNLTRG